LCFIKSLKDVDAAIVGSGDEMIEVLDDLTLDGLKVAIGVGVLASLRQEVVSKVSVHLN